MAKNHYKFKKTKKALIAVLLATAVSCTGLAAACGGDSGDNTETAPKKEDTQLLKNGDFEFYTTPTDEALKKDKAKYLIKTPVSGTWSSGGDSSNAKSGIIGTTDTAWSALADDGLAAKLDYNADLSSSADDYIDYNGMKSRDILYKDTYAALLAANKIKDDGIINEQGYEKYFGIVDGKIGDKPVYRNGEDGEYYFELPVERDGAWYLGETLVYQNPDDKEFYRDESYSFCLSVRTQLIENPGTHYDIVKGENDALSTTIGETTYDVHEDEYGNYYYYTDNAVSEDVDDKNYFSNVLMLHNYPADSNYNGIHQYYTSQSVTLEANTAAEISVWVKTSNLKFARGYSQLGEEDRGAYIEVSQTIGGNTVDAFKIKAINTEKILADADNADIKNDKTITNNGWIKYTVYVEGCDFGESTVTLNLGLGQSDNYEKLNGYAFFDDVQVKKFTNLNDEGCTYTDNSAKIDKDTTCTLTSDKNEKVFVADKAYTDRNLGRYEDRLRNSKDFHYLLNLTSASAETSQITFGSNVTASLTTEKSATGKLYASAKQLTGVKTAGGINITQNNNGNEYTLPKELKNPLITDDDTLGAFPYNETAFADSIFSGMLAENLTADGAKLPGYTGNMLVMHSRYGAAYTSTVKDDAFKLEGGEHLILSFWVKTADMKGRTAATLVITDIADDKNTTSFEIDTTGKTTDVAGKEDIYNGWVQCFFFVANDTTTAQQFKIDFKFGNTTINGTTNYYYGWTALANMQVLKVDEDVYNLTSAGTTSQKFSFTADTDEATGVEFDSASGTSEIKNGVVNASNYDGYNGASSSVTDGSYKKNYDGKNTNYETNAGGDVTRYAGLINKTNFDNYNNKNDIIKAFGGADSFTNALEAWESVFGKTCYQPLIIINNLRAYVEQAEATKENYKNYYVEADEGYSGTEATFEANGKLYRKVRDDEEYDENTEYYSESDIVKVANYGFVGTPKTISSSSYEAVSVKVKVSGNATAYVYLVDDTTRKVLGYATPAYTYYYDNEGNVLDKNFDGLTEEEHRAAIIYTSRKDGLYDGKDGKVYANLGNYKKLYKYSDNENKDFFDESGANVTYDNLQTLNFGEKYYTDAGKTAEAAHFLINSEGKNIYEYKNGAYYYIVKNGDEYVTSDVEVNNFDSTYARYVSEKNYGEYAVAITADNAAKDADGWVTVNFFVHTGSSELKYRLELWSGKRGETGVDGDNNYETGAVAFDYSAITVSESEYTGILNDCELEIREDYVNLLKGKIPEDDFGRTDIAYYEQLAAKELGAEKVKELQDKYGYDAKYYAYTLYDSESYVPFNAETAKDGETGYDYSVTDEISNEKLAYFTYTNKEMHTVSVFADYSAVQQDIQMNTVDDGDDGDDDATDNAGEAWLLASSIVLLVAILITLVSLLLRDVFKKHRRKKNAKEISKNNYRKRQRYIRKLHLSTESEEPDEEPVTESEPAEESGETGNAETPAEEPAPETDGEPAAETEQPEAAPEETEEPATDVEDQPSEEPSADTPAEDNGESENK